MAKLPENGIAFKFPQGQAISFDPEAFDTAIRSQGVQLIHYRAMRCPVGIIDQYDQRKPHDDHSGCSNGFIYTEAGRVTAMFTGVTEEMRQLDMGLLDGSTVQVTVPRFYDDTEDELVRVAPFDRLYLAQEEVTVVHWQLAEAHVTGREKLSFPVVRVLDLMDANGRRYGDDDYRIENGQIVWVGAQPGFDAARNKGTIFSVRYEYRPYFYVTRMMHETRVAQVDTPLERKVLRMPQAFLLTREFSFEKEDKDEFAEDASSARQVKGPRDGAFGPR